MPAGIEGTCMFNDLRFSTLECNYILECREVLGKTFFPRNKILFKVVMVAAETCNFWNDL
jgi:hypothetical protein